MERESQTAQYASTRLADLILPLRLFSLPPYTSLYLDPPCPWNRKQVQN